MLKFESEQKVYDIGEIKMGGQPGEYPTVLIGSIFYHGHDIVTDEKAGDFDKEKAEALLKKEEAVSETTGNPRIVDVCSAWPRSFDKYIEYVAEHIEGPFTIDGTTSSVRIAGLKYVEEVGLGERVIYNSVQPQIKDDEIMAIKDAKINSAILLTYNAKNPTIQGRLESLDSVLSVAKQAGIENCLIDVAVLDKPDPGPISKCIHLVKERYGLPAGAGSHNAVATWAEQRNLDKNKRLMALSVANALPISFGADFILYGPIHNAKYAYFHTAFADACVAFSMMQEYGIKPANRSHPLFRIFRE
ncbi:tetrahydromethanopterin S-methyltransferase subunit H [Candidatus Thorarchaeota archaeon]|nr:MAG: tetrahydromethanopterin S-methyltransferase subunit H [Candidatus Thorarchaeota archaeon]